MSKGPWIKRIDRMGSTADVPYTRTIFDAKRERWIMDRFYYLMGRGSWFFENPGEMIGVGLVRGYNYFDMNDTGGRIKCLDEVTKENVRTAGLPTRSPTCRRIGCATAWMACLPNRSAKSFS